MKIKDQFPNFTSALMFFLKNKNPVLSSNDSRLYSHFIPLAIFKNGNDSYDLTPHKNGGVYFSLVTMIGFRIILRTDSEIFYKDISEYEWKSVIAQITVTHFSREEYQALKRGYVKKKSGCFSSMLLTLLFGFLVFAMKII